MGVYVAQLQFGTQKLYVQQGRTLRYFIMGLTFTTLLTLTADAITTLPTAGPDGDGAGQHGSFLVDFIGQDSDN